MTRNTYVPHPDRSDALNTALTTLNILNKGDNASGAIDDEEMVNFYINMNEKTTPSIGRRLKKSRSRKKRIHNNKLKIKAGMNVENAMIYGIMHEEMTHGAAKRLFGKNNTWQRKGIIENDIIIGMDKGHYWINALKGHPDLSMEEAQNIQDYYLMKLYDIFSDDQQWGSGRRRKKTRYRHSKKRSRKNRRKGSRRK